MSASILSDVNCHLGEGPTYDPATGTLYWFDIRERKLFEKRMPDAEPVVHELPEMTSALAVIDADRQLIATETGLYVRDVKSGKLTLHTPLEAGNADTRANDARVHPCGAFWVGTMSRTERAKAGAIYWFFRGELRLLIPGITVPNSICFSPDGAIAYFTGLEGNMLMRVACDPATGLPTGEPRVFADTRNQKGWLDGSVCDADGTVWNARWDGACIDAYAPDGRLVKTVPLPARRTTCPAFVGKRADRMIVTSAWQGLSDEERAADPNAGRTFLLDLPVRGRHEPKVLI